MLEPELPLTVLYGLSCYAADVMEASVWPEASRQASEALMLHNISLFAQMMKAYFHGARLTPLRYCQFTCTNFEIAKLYYIYGDSSRTEISPTFTFSLKRHLKGTAISLPCCGIVSSLCYEMVAWMLV